jgi:CheY-like chemotaxis protein
VPSRQVLEVVRTDGAARTLVSGGEVLRHRDETLPYYSLSGLLTRVEAEEPWILIVLSGNRRSALAVPSLVGEWDLLRHPVDRLLGASDHIGGSATLDDGRLVLLLALVGVVRQAALHPSVTRRPAAPTRRRARVLVVEDSAIVRDLVAHVLVGAGFEVRTAADGRAGLALVEALVPDVILADVEMPVMDGFELLRQVRARWPHLPYVLLTTRGSVEDRRLAAALGANAHLVKSGFQEAMLVSTVRRFVDQAP